MGISILFYSDNYSDIYSKYHKNEIIFLQFYVYKMNTQDAKLKETVSVLGWDFIKRINESSVLKDLNIWIRCEKNHELILNYARILTLIRNNKNSQKVVCEMCEIEEIISSHNYYFLNSSILQLFENNTAFKSNDIHEILITYKCNNNHEITEAYKDIYKKRTQPIICESCKIKDLIEKMGWEYINSSGSFTSKETIVSFKCHNHHQISCKFIPAIKNLASTFEGEYADCHRCMIDNVLNKLKWSFVSMTDEYAIKEVNVTCKCYNDHIITLPYKTLQVRATRRENNNHLSPAECDKCYRHDPQVMYDALRNAGFDIDSLPKDSLDVLSYTCKQCSQRIGKISYNSFIQNKSRNPRCISCAKITTVDTVQNIKGIIIEIKRNYHNKKADIVINCIECGENYTCILSNLKKSNDTTRCAKCKHKKLLNDLEYIKTEISNKGVEWVGGEGEYKNRRSKLTLSCSCGTTFEQNLANIRNGRKFCCNNKETAIGVLNKYNVDCVFKLQGVHEKKAYTNKEFYGNINWLASCKGKQYMMDKYGVENSMQNPDVFYKAMISQYRIKYYELPSGKLLSYMGYENFAIDLILNKYNEDIIINDNKIIPKFDWICKDNKKHVYTPDIMLILYPNNLIIEVKSTYTFLCACKDGSLFLKIQAIVDKGYKAEVWVFDNKKLLEIHVIENNNFICIKKSICGIPIYNN